MGSKVTVSADWSDAFDEEGNLRVELRRIPFLYPRSRVPLEVFGTGLVVDGEADFEIVLTVEV